jgi:hypothetical protein
MHTESSQTDQLFIKSKTVVINKSSDKKLVYNRPLSAMAWHMLRLWTEVRLPSMKDSCGYNG